jgi:hypothetical protein
LGAKDLRSSITTDNLRQKVRTEMNLFYGNHFIYVKLALGIFLQKEEDKKNNKNAAKYQPVMQYLPSGCFNSVIEPFTECKCKTTLSSHTSL